MKSHKPFALLLALATVASTSVPIVGQSIPPPGTTLTLEEYAGLQERTNAFCLYLNNAVKEGTPVPAGGLTIPGAGNGYVYTAEEVKALTAHCDLLMRLMQQVIDGMRQPRPGSGIPR
jgi:hypothetical protein